MCNGRNMDNQKISFEDFIEEKKLELLNDINTNKKTVEDIASAYGVSVSMVKIWQETFTKKENNVCNT